LSEKWFGPIPKKSVLKNNIPVEPLQKEKENPHSPERCSL
jgi:hypothetical protein